jgi:transposase
MIDFSSNLWYNYGMENDVKVAALEAEITDLKQQVQLLQEQLRLAKHRQFGTSSEKSAAIDGGEQLSVFNEAEATVDPTAPEPTLEQVAAHTRKKPKGKREMDFLGLPVEQLVHELPESERVCPDCGGSMHACGHEVYRRELTVIPAQFKVTEHLQTAYSCRHCEKVSDDTVLMRKSAVPAPVIRGSGVASPSLLAYIAHQKYVLALPLYRQEQEFKRLGINLSRQTMANWLIYASTKYLRPIYGALKAQLLTRQVLHADETDVQVLREPGKTPQSKSKMWLYRSSGDTERPVVLYDYQPDRCHRRPADFLEGWSGYLHTDGYQAYKKLQNVTVIACLAHVRRKFTDVLKTLPETARAGSESMRGKEFCDQLFALEREFAKLPPDGNFKARYEARLKKSKPVMDAFFDWAKNSNALPQSGLGKAVAYVQNERFYLEHVLLDGRLELSNNRAERSVKPFVTGRKNWMFADTVNGAKATATLYSIVETAKENGLHPFDYLEFVFNSAPGLDFGNHPAALERLLPWNTPPDLQRTEKPCASLPWDES